MPMLPGPYEILDLEDGQSVTLDITSWEEGDVVIHPYRAPEGIVVTALRVHVTPESKKTVPYYWDITAKTLIAGLKPLLIAGKHLDNYIKITKVGERPRARFMVELIPKK